MTKAHVLDDYNAHGVQVPDSMLGWMRSNHAGETGAVWIYKGAGYVFWSQTIREMAAEHGETERHHLVVMSHLVPRQHRSKLLPLWKVMGFGLGFLPSLFGYKAFCITISAVETFVEAHYKEQIDELNAHHDNPDLLALIKRCCDEEVHHQQDAHQRIDNHQNGFIGRLWSRMVGWGSGLAVKAATKF